MRPLVWRQHTLRQAHLHERAHLAEALQRCFARIGNFAFVGRSREIALSKPAIIMRRPDQPIEIDFNSGHARRPVIVSSSFTAPAATRLAIGQAE